MLGTEGLSQKLVRKALCSAAMPGMEKPKYPVDEVLS
jgi:hypothetical protein